MTNFSGRTFLVCQNNGVAALADERVVADRNRRHVIEGRLGSSLNVGLAHMGVPIFTFTGPERGAVPPWYTGSSEMLEQITRRIVAGGGRVENGSIFVPFSNGAELGVHGPEAQRVELSFVTTWKQFTDTFGDLHDA